MQKDMLNLTPEPERNITYYCTFQDKSGYQYCPHAGQWDITDPQAIVECKNIDKHCAYRKCTITPYFPDQQ